MQIQMEELTIQRKVQQEELEELVRGDKTEDFKSLLLRKGRDAVLQPVPSRINTHNNAIHLAVENDAEQCLALLLNLCPQDDILNAPNHDGMTPLLLAVRRGKKPSIVKMLLDNGANANARDDKGYTPLHLLVDLLKDKRNPDEVKALLVMTEHLLDQNSIDLEPHAKLTPLADAVCRVTDDDLLNKNLLSYCNILVQRGASLQEVTSEGSARQILERNQALASLKLDLMTSEGSAKEILERNQALTSEMLAMHSVPPQRPALSCFLDSIVNNNSSEDDIKKFLRCKNDCEAKELSNSLLGQHSVLYMAVDACNEVRVKTLLDHKADQKREEPTGSLPLYRAAELGHLPIFNLLLLNMKGEAPKVDLKDHTMSLMQKLMENWKGNTGHGDCFNRLLKADVELNVNQEHNGCTPIHVAAAFNKQEAVMKLVQHGTFLGASKVLPLIRASTLEQALNGCIKHLPRCDTLQESEDLKRAEYTLLLDYRFLLPPGAESQYVNEVATLMEIGSSQQHRHIIKHPLVQTLLIAKWIKIRPIYLVMYILQAIFAIYLTMFGHVLTNLRRLEANNDTSDQKEVIDNPTGFVHNLTDQRQREANNETSVQQIDIDGHIFVFTLLKIILVALTFYMVAREVVQIYFTRKQYLKNIENYMDCALIIIVFILCFTKLSIDCTRHLAAWAMFFAWYEYVLVLGRLPGLQLYLTMLRQVSGNFFKFIVIFGALLMAFTTSFSMILEPSETLEEGDEGSFQEVVSSLTKFFVMSTGEFEYSSFKRLFPNNIFTMISTVIMFIVFIFLIFFVLMNLMNALAVGDVKKVIDDAKVWSLKSELEMVYLTEAVLLLCMSSRCPSCLKSLFRRLHLLSSSRNSCKLLAKINKTKIKQQLFAGKIPEEWNQNMEENLSPIILNNATAQSFRNYLVAYLEKLEAAKESEDQLKTMVQMKDKLNDMVRIEDRLNDMVQMKDQLNYIVQMKDQLNDMVQMKGQLNDMVNLLRRLVGEK